MTLFPSTNDAALRELRESVTTLLTSELTGATTVPVLATPSLLSRVTIDSALASSPVAVVLPPVEAAASATEVAGRWLVAQVRLRVIENHLLLAKNPDTPGADDISLRLLALLSGRTIDPPAVVLTAGATARRVLSPDEAGKGRAGFDLHFEARLRLTPAPSIALRFAGHRLSGCRARPGGALLDLALADSRLWQDAPLLRAATTAPFDRGNAQRALSVRIRREHSSAEAAALFAVDHGQSLPARGELILDAVSSAGRESRRLMPEAALRTVAVDLHGHETTHRYEFVGALII